MSSRGPPPGACIATNGGPPPSAVLSGEGPPPGVLAAAPAVTYEPGVLYVHTFSREWTRQTVNISPYAIKLETWLRLNHVPYEVVFPANQYQSPTKQIPYIYYNGQVMADSGLIIEHLMQERGMDPTEGLTPEQQGIGRAITQMAECSTIWTLFHARYVQHMTGAFSRVFRMNPVPAVDAKIKAMFSHNVEEGCKSQGIGRKTPEDIAKIAKRDMTALAQCLGEKPFFLGDKPTVVDCSVFGLLSQIVPVDMPYPHKAVLTSEAGGSNLVAFMERMKQAAWPDWDKLVNNEPFPV